MPSYEIENPNLRRQVERFILGEITRERLEKMLNQYQGEIKAGGENVISRGDVNTARKVLNNRDFRSDYSAKNRQKTEGRSGTDELNSLMAGMISGRKTPGEISKTVFDLKRKGRISELDYENAYRVVEVKRRQESPKMIGRVMRDMGHGAISPGEAEKRIRSFVKSGDVDPEEANGAILLINIQKQNREKTEEAEEAIEEAKEEELGQTHILARKAKKGDIERSGENALAKRDPIYDAEFVGDGPQWPPPDRKALPPGPQYPMLPAGPERKMLPGREQKYLPPGKERKALPPGKAQLLLGPGNPITLEINSVPIQGIIIYVDGKPYQTPQKIQLPSGNHTLEAEPSRKAFKRNFTFREWEDGSTNRQRTIQLIQNTRVIARYDEGAVQSKFVCPPEIIKLARWMIRRLPQTEYKELLETFKKYPRVAFIIANNEYGDKTEEKVEFCFLQEYRAEFAAAKRGAFSFSGRQPFVTEVERDIFRKSLSARVGKRGLFDTGPEKTDKYKINVDPLTRSAINRGRRILRRAARAKFREMMQDPSGRIKAAQQELKNARDEYNKEIKKLDAYIKSVRQAELKWKHDIDAQSILDIDSDNPLGGLSKIMSRVSGTRNVDQSIVFEVEKLHDQITRLHKDYEDAKKKLEDLENQFTAPTGAKLFSDKMKDSLEAQRDKILESMRSEYWKFGDPYEAGTKLNNIKEALDGEVNYLSERYAKVAVSRYRRINRFILGMSNTLRATSASTQTFGESWTQLLHNIWNLFFGPWTIGTIFVLIQFFFVLTYVGYNIQLLWIMPMIAAGITFILNFTETRRPFDWITHLASGAMIGYSASLFLIAIGGTEWSFVMGTGGFGGFWYWILWGILVFIGIFQFYQSEG